MKLPRNVSGTELAVALERRGYRVTRQTGSHMRLTTERGGIHHVSVPAHKPLRVGTFAAILAAVANHFGITRDELVAELFG